eukprot:TRINITY_DN22762_c0_g1_i1.p1 TRINITY_DN22762_c0_g1~~TRINITY_DN22762_c0_g1_i1.p1  ORF type:complete len:262 (+),score=58.39 TRINITY_DN22762_c0_g1_i1:66-851(+)
MAYGGWTFAFADYYAANITANIDTPGFQNLLKIVDPIQPNYVQRLSRLPINVIVSSDDEFMMFEWTNIWWGNMTGEKHLTIIGNADHSLQTGLRVTYETMTCFYNPVYTAAARPVFTSSLDFDNGVISVDVPSGQTLKNVSLRYADTFSTTRRDFRWVRFANEQNGACTPPEETLPNPVFGGNCFVPIFWYSEDLTEVAPGKYQASVPEREEGWTGFYIELVFASGTGLDVDYLLTSPGMVWPNTLPFPDCHGSACYGTLL